MIKSKRKNKIILAALLFTTTIFFAQVGIGTTSPQGALDIVSTNSGVIIPRVENTAAVANPVAGMVVYDTSCHCFKGSQNGSWSILSVLNEAPSAQNVSFSGSLNTGETLTGSYTYSDAESDSEGVSIFAWYRATDVSGSDAVVIPGATQSTYTLQESDAGYIAFSVRAVATKGVSEGSIVFSEFKQFIAVPAGEVVGAGGAVWMDRNLGATAVATSYDDSNGYGDLYQWGRNTDGHEKRSSSIVTGPVASGAEGGEFVSSNSDWLTVSDDTRWNGATKGVHDPCPDGFRVPTSAEFQTEISSWASPTARSFNGPLKIPSAGGRGGWSSSVDLYGAAQFAYLWTSSINQYGSVEYIQLDRLNNNVLSLTTNKARGASVRCIKDE